MNVIKQIQISTHSNMDITALSILITDENLYISAINTDHDSGPTVTFLVSRCCQQTNSTNNTGL